MSVASAKAPFIEFQTTAQVAKVSAASGVVFNKVLPEGKWLVTGSVQATGDTGSLTNIALITPIRTLYSFVDVVGPTSNRIPVSFLYASDGTTALTMTLTCSTTAGTWSSIATIVDCDKLLA